MLLSVAVMRYLVGSERREADLGRLEVDLADALTRSQLRHCQISWIISTLDRATIDALTATTTRTNAHIIIVHFSSLRAATSAHWPQ